MASVFFIKRLDNDEYLINSHRFGSTSDLSIAALYRRYDNAERSARGRIRSAQERNDRAMRLDDPYRVEAYPVLCVVEFDLVRREVFHKPIE